MTIKSDIDRKVYDRNDILKKDAYFEQTVMTEIKTGMDTLGVVNSREDRVLFRAELQSSISSNTEKHICRIRRRNQ